MHYKLKRLALLIVVIFCISSTPGRNAAENIQQSELQWLQQWFNAWELLSNEILQLPTDSAPEMLFFDSTYVFTTSNISAPNGTKIDGPSFFGQKLSWKKMRHNGELTLPDGQEVPIGLMSFASPTPDGKRFFVMAAPSFWQAAGVKSDELGLDKLITGVFLHEFAHIRQFQGFGKQIDSLWTKHAFGDTSALSDDIVQHIFKSDSEYVRVFREETDMFYNAANAPSTLAAKQMAATALDRLASRQQKYFTGEKAVLKDLDNIFLSMEGLGQFVAVLWLTHPKGGKVPTDVAINGFRRKRNQWSQDEGLSLFLVLTKIVKPDWAKDMFSEQPANIIDLLTKAVGKIAP